MQTSGVNLQPHTPDPGDAVSVFIDNGAPLPDTYGDNCLVAMARDPRTIFVYWDVQPTRLEPLRQEWGHQLDQAITVLRVYDVTDRMEENIASASYFDVEVSFDARDHYVALPQAGRQHRLELGLRLPNGTFVSLLSSNVVLSPNGQVSDDVDAKWVAVRSQQEYEAWEKVLHNVDIGRGSAEFSRQMAQRWQFLKSVFSMGMAPSSLPHMPSSLPSSLPHSGTPHE